MFSKSFRYLSILIAFLYVGTFAKAAQCCGWRGGDSDENNLWNARAKLCNNVWSNEKQNNGYIAKADIGFGPNGMQYAFWAKDGNNRFSNCWEATGQIITQCFRGNSGAGTWEWDQELYAMSATTSSQYKRDDVPVEDLPTLPPTTSGTISEIKLDNGTYNILGRPVNIAITGINLGQYRSHPTRSEGELVTNSGPIGNFTIIKEQTIDLEAAIQALVQDVTGPQGLEKRGQTCRASGSYVMMEYGNWWTGYSLASGKHECSVCSHAIGTSQTTSESFSIGISGDVKGKIASAAWSFGYGWERSYTSSSTRTCSWTEGGCHTIWREQPMAYQGGFVLDSWASEYQVWISIKWVHSDAPLKFDNLDCNRGCCSGAVTSQYGRWDNCKYAAGKECWYGTCRDWDNNCNAVSPC